MWYIARKNNKQKELLHQQNRWLALIDHVFSIFLFNFSLDFCVLSKRVTQIFTQFLYFSGAMLFSFCDIFLKYHFSFSMSSSHSDFISKLSGKRLIGSFFKKIIILMLQSISKRVNAITKIHLNHYFYLPEKALGIVENIYNLQSLHHL